MNFRIQKKKADSFLTECLLASQGVSENWVSLNWKWPIASFLPTYGNRKSRAHVQAPKPIFV